MCPGLPGVLVPQYDEVSGIQRDRREKGGEKKLPCGFVATMIGAQG